LNSSATVYTVPEGKALEENLVTRFSKIQANDDQRVRVQQMTPEAKMPTKGSTGGAGYDLYANEQVKILAKGQAVIGTGIAIGLPPNTYGRIAPRSGLAVKHHLAVNAGGYRCRLHRRGQSGLSQSRK